ncbi:CASP-like protein 4A3 [Bienertia sinuspersici]
MQNHHKPPRPPPLSVSSTTPLPPPQPKAKPKPDESPESPLRSDDYDTPNNSGAMVVVDQYLTPSTSPLPVTPPKDATTPDNFSSPPHQIIHLNRREEPSATSGVVLGDGGERKGKVGRGEKRGGVNFGSVKDIVRKSSKEDLIEKLNLGIRVYQIVFCLISFSVMAADRTQGWSGDSFDRYKEYRFSIIAYLLISASSAAASRIDDWQANWGKDEFTEKASASVSMAFLAFLGFATSSLITGYNLCNRDLS